MAFTWDQQQIDWYRQASDFAPFHQDLAALLLPYLKKEDVLCDWGAGLGRLSLELAPHLARVVCIDSDQAVLETLEGEKEKRGITNLETVVADAGSLRTDCDVSLMVFFGTPPTLMFRCLSQTRRLLIRIMNEEEPKKGRESLSDVEKALQERGYPYEKRLIRLDFGQPFLSLQDVRGYLDVYPPDGPAGPDGLPAGLEQTGREDYPYYLPKEKQLAALFIRPDCRENPQDIGAFKP